MTIINDIITFTPADFSGLSAFAQLALANSPFTLSLPIELSLQANSRISSAKERLKSIEAKDPTVDSILSGLATADAPTLALAAPILASLDALLNP